MSISQNHARLIHRHIAAMFVEFASSHIGARLETHLDVFRIADDFTEFTAALKSVVETIGTDDWPEIEGIGIGAWPPP